jgi:predicted Fe-S protein YdhL (DUF1289 family)
MDEAASPCIRICQMDRATGLCIGCLRTLAEIAAWGGLGGAEKARIAASLPRRNAPLAELHPAAGNES